MTDAIDSEATPAACRGDGWQAQGARWGSARGVRVGVLTAAGVLAAGIVCAEPPGWPALPARDECEAVLTVIKSDCSVEHVFRCAGGIQRNESLKQDEAAPTVEHSRGPLTGWTYAHPEEGFFVMLPDLQPVLVMADLSTDRSVEVSGPVMMWTPLFVEPFTGTYLEAPSVEARDADLDGIALTRLRVDVDMALNGGALSFSGWEHRFVATGLGVSFTGKSSVVAFGSVEETEADPVALIRPGEAGFLERPEPTDCELFGSAVPGGRSFLQEA